MFQTKKGTKVRHPLASGSAIVFETLRGALEYKVYKDFRVGDLEAPRFDAVEGDNLLVYECADIPTLANVLNLVTGNFALVPWETLGNCIKPYNP